MRSTNWPLTMSFLVTRRTQHVNEHKPASRRVWSPAFGEHPPTKYNMYLHVCILRHIGLLEADEDKIRKIRPKGTLFRILYVPRDV